MKNLRKILVSCLVLLALVFVSAPKVHAAADIAVASAKVTSANTVLVTFANPGQNLASTVAADYHIDINTGGTSPLTPSSAVVTSATLWTVTLTFSGTPFSNTASAYDSSHGLYLDAGAVTDTNADTNAVVLHSASTAITDGQLPTFTASRTALNTIVLTYSEPISETAIANSYTVAGASSVTNSVAVASTTVTLTTVGLTSTSSTPAVNYVAATGDVADAAANEAADGGAVVASDHVAPTFTADRTALNTIVLTYSEPVTETAILNSYTVAGASAVTNSAVVAGTSVTLTTTGLTSTSSTPAVGYVAATGDVADAAANETANGGAVSATDHVAPTLAVTLSDNDITSSQTFLVTFTFSENPTGFDANDVTVGHGTLGAIDSTNPLVQTATFTPNPVTTTDVVSVGTGWTDSSAAHNAPAGVSTSATYTITASGSNGGSSGHHSGGGGGGSSSGSSSTATTVACAPGQAFSSTTGAKCTTTVAPVTCAPGAMFSATTGEKCSPATVVFCSAGQMFNATSGAQCTTYLPGDTTTVGASSFGTTLVKLGTTGDACKAWQTYFNAHGASLTVDGNCGPKTIAFAKTWQASVGITADGVLGAVSRSKAI